MVLREHRLRIEGIHLRHAAVHEEENYAFRLSCKVRLLGRERIFGSAADAAKGERTKAPILVLLCYKVSRLLSLQRAQIACRTIVRGMGVSGQRSRLLKIFIS